MSAKTRRKHEGEPEVMISVTAPKAEQKIIHNEPIPHEHHTTNKKNWFLHVYDRHYKALMLITLFILLASFFVIGFNYYAKGDFLNRGVSLKGGSTITISGQIDALTLQDELNKEFPNLEISARTVSEAGRAKGVLIDTSAKEKAEIESLINYFKSKEYIKGNDYSIETIGSSLGSDFFRQAMIALLFSFALMAIVVFITFKDPIPSFFVVFAAFSTIVSTWAVVILIGTKLSTAGIAAFVMLILYSVDTDILLTTRVLKRKEGSILDRTLDAMKTGMLMTTTALVTTLIAYFLSPSEVIKQIMMILSIGLVFDILNTWIQNAGILRWHLENKMKKNE